LSAEANKLPAIHIAGNDGVTFKRVPPKSFVRPRNPESRSLQTFRDPQGLRRPRFSFFIFTCQTARGPRTPLPVREQSVRNLPRKLFRTPHSTTNDNRLPPAVDSLISVRSFTGTITCLGQGPRQRRAQWAVYKPARSALSTPVVNKSSYRARESCTA
jgi:hypothetical protein